MTNPGKSCSSVGCLLPTNEGGAEALGRCDLQHRYGCPGGEASDQLHLASRLLSCWAWCPYPGLSSQPKDLLLLQSADGEFLRISWRGECRDWSCSTVFWHSRRASSCPTPVGSAGWPLLRVVSTRWQSPWFLEGPCQGSQELVAAVTDNAFGRSSRTRGPERSAASRGTIWDMVRR